MSITAPFQYELMSAVFCSTPYAVPQKHSTLRMRQTDYAIGKARKRRRRKHLSLQLAICADATASLQMRAWRKSRKARHDVRRIRLRSLQMKTHYFNLNAFSNEQALRDFRFRVCDIPTISDVTGWAGKTKRNRYRCDPLTAFCIILRKLFSTCRWKDVEFMFGIRSSDLSEVFWEVVESLVEGKGHLVCEFRAMLVERAEMYADAIGAKGAPLDSCVGFIDCTKIRMSRPGVMGLYNEVVTRGIIACTALYIKL